MGIRLAFVTDVTDDDLGMFVSAAASRFDRFQLRATEGGLQGNGGNLVSFSGHPSYILRISAMSNGAAVE
jgi:hypothetical protein